jgi:hypothetical protein
MNNQLKQHGTRKPNYAEGVSILAALVGPLRLLRLLHAAGEQQKNGLASGGRPAILDVAPRTDAQRI